MIPVDIPRETLAKPSTDTRVLCVSMNKGSEQMATGRATPLMVLKALAVHFPGPAGIALKSGTSGRKEVSPVQMDLARPWPSLL